MTSRPMVVPAGYDRMVHITEEIRTFTPFGLRLWDWSLDRPVSNGLRVRARPLAGGKEVDARVNRNGIFVLADVPELRHVETPAIGDPIITTDTVPFSVRITDSSGRFLTAGFTVDLPNVGIFPAQGSLTPLNGSPIDEPGFPLFSASTRSTPPGFAVVRAHLIDEATAGAAAHAVIRVEVGGNTWFGVSAADGQVAVVFPFPNFDPAPAIAPPDSGGIPPTDQSFDAVISVRYAQLDVDPWLGVPAFDAVRSQAPARIRPVLGNAAVETITAPIQFGIDLVLTTQDHDQSVLLIEAA